MTRGSVTCRAPLIGGRLRGGGWGRGDDVRGMVYWGLQGKGIAALSQRLRLEGDTSLRVG
jgi:hypothetical protein